MSVWESLELVLLSFLEVIIMAIEQRRGRPLLQLLCVLCLFKTSYTLRIALNFFNYYYSFIFLYFSAYGPLNFFLAKKLICLSFLLPQPFRTDSFLHILNMSETCSLYIDQIWDLSSPYVFSWHIQGVRLLTPRFISLFHWSLKPLTMMPPLWQSVLSLCFS